MEKYLVIGIIVLLTLIGSSYVVSITEHANKQMQHRVSQIDKAIEQACK